MFPSIHILVLYNVTCSLSVEVSGVAIGKVMIESSTKFLGGGIDSKANPLQGVDITVWSKSGDFSAMGYIVDQLDSLIDEWFPGKFNYTSSKSTSIVIKFSVNVYSTPLEFSDFLSNKYYITVHDRVYFVQVEFDSGLWNLMLGVAS